MFPSLLGAPVAAAAGYLAAAETDPTADPLGAIGKEGVLGALAALLIWFAFRAYKRESERADREAEKNDRLNETIQEKYVPALEAATGALRDQGASTAALNQLLADLRSEVHRLRYERPPDEPDPPPRRRAPAKKATTRRTR